MSTRALVVACLATAACTGMSLGENEPGGDTWVEPTPPQPGEHRMGAIAVERDEDQLWVVHEENQGDTTRAHLAAIDPTTGATAAVMDVSGVRDRRVVFPADDRMILMAETGGRDQLVLIDTRTRRMIASAAKEARYHGTRTSPSGRRLVVADDLDPAGPIHVIDTGTLSHEVLDHGGDLVEAMWNHDEEVLLALSVTDPWGDTPVARLLRYDFTGVAPGAAVPTPSVAWELDGYAWDFLFSYTWIGISPDDRWAVFPLIKRTTGPDDGEHVLLVLDQSTGAVTLEPGRGPVGFTRDSRWIVSYGPGGGGQDLWLIDPATRERRVVDLPFDAGVSFAVSRETDAIVCVPVSSDEAFGVIYDVAADALIPIPDGDVSLWEYVTRRGSDELWLVSGGALKVLSLSAGTLEDLVDGSARVSTINVRPSADEAVVGSGERAWVQRIDMASRDRIGAAIRLPSPYDTSAPATFPQRRSRVRDDRVQSAFDPAYRAAPTAARPGARVTFEPR